MNRPSWRARLACAVVRRRIRPALGDLSDPLRVRKVFAGAMPAPGGVRYRADTVGGIAGEWVEPAAGAAPETTLLYLHGGAFIGCSPRTHRPVTASLARRGLRVFVPDYRLAPEHPFPAGPKDVLAAWQGLRASVPGRLVVAGDSAGGNLALGLMLTLRDTGAPLPEAAVMFSPVTDLTGGSASLHDNADADAMFPGREMHRLAAAYLAGADAAQPLASPLLADLHGLPPLLLHVGEQEALRDDSLRLVQRVREAGGVAGLQVFDGVPHVWQLLPWLPEARRSLDAAAHFLRETQREGAVETLDVLIVGAGLSGVGAAVHLKQHGPAPRVALLEAREAIGGTWDLFRYPGVRSDSDMYTLGYEFKPWQDPQAIADGPSIRDYIRETAREHHVDRDIRLQHRVVGAQWDSASACWTVAVERGPERRPLVLRARFLMFCAGYYRYAQGHRPQWPGEAQYRGRLVHPQCWPADLDHAGQRVVVIGSGATAVTLVPEMARSAAHVTMLQRSPTYMVSRPGRDELAESLKRRLPPMWAYRLVRAKNVLLTMLFFQLARRWPQQTGARLVGGVRAQLGSRFDVARDFTPRYKPWDQRVCLVPDGDLFRALREGRASVVTDEIETFTPEGLRLKSGRELAADIVVTATGLQLNLLGDVPLQVDGRPVDLSQALVYKGMMYSGVPNLTSTFGYTNASWTLKADLTARFVCRLLRHMQARGWRQVQPQRDPAVQPEPFLDFSSGYVQRALPMLPKQGDRHPWRLYQNYLRDWLLLRAGRVADGVLKFDR